MKYASKASHLQLQYQSYISTPGRSLCPLKCVWCILGPVYVLLWSQRGLNTDMMADRRHLWPDTGSPYRVDQERGAVLKRTDIWRVNLAKQWISNLEKIQKCCHCFAIKNKWYIGSGIIMFRWWPGLGLICVCSHELMLWLVLLKLLSERSFGKHFTKWCIYCSRSTYGKQNMSFQLSFWCFYMDCQLWEMNTFLNQPYY